MKARFALSLLLMTTLGCSLPVTGGTPTTTARIKRPSADGGHAGRVPLERETRMVATDAASLVGKVKLIGKVKLLSDKGAGIISNNTGSLVSNNGGGLVSDKGAGYRVRAAGALEEALLAEAEFEVLDAEGRVLVDAEGQPIGGSTDATGSYSFEATLPAENLTLRVRLFDGGQLFALLPHVSGEAPRTQDIDTASSLGAVYVLERYVKKRKAVYDLLPAREADLLYQAMAGARSHLGEEAPVFTPETQVALAEKLRQASKEVDSTLERIEAILVAGQANLGEGRQATEVSLSNPIGVGFDAQGRLLIAEGTGGRLRRVLADGTMQTYAGPRASGEGTIAASFGLVTHVLVAPDGNYVAELGTGRVRRLTPTGQIEVVAGTGKVAYAPVAGPAASTTIGAVSSIARAPDGTLYIGEASGYLGVRSGRGRLLKVDPQGQLSEVSTNGPEWEASEITGLAVAPDGTLYAAAGKDSVLARLKPGGSWEFPTTPLGTGPKCLMAGPDGTLYVSEFSKHRLWRFTPDLAPTHLAGSGELGHSPDGTAAKSASLGEPAGMTLRPDGTLVFAEAGNGLVRALKPDGTLSTIAGAWGVTQQGDALRVAINAPSSVAFDPQGRMVITETTGNAIKRLENGRLSVLVGGGGKGFAGDGGPAQTARLDYPAGIAYGPDGSLYICDGANVRIRKVDPSGTISTIAGDGSPGTMRVMTELRAPAFSSVFGRPGMIAIGPDQLPYITDIVNNQVLRVTADGFVEIVAGSPGQNAEAPAFGDAGDGGPANKALLHTPTGLAFDKAGNLYISDSTNLRIRKVTPDGVITTFAGMPTAATVLKVLSGQSVPKAGTPATEVALLAPIALTFDADGNMYVATLGTTNMELVGELPELPLDGLPRIEPNVLKIAPDGGVSVVAGPGGKVLTDPAAEDALRLPLGLSIDPEGRLVIVDAGANQVKLVPKSAL